MASSLTPEQQFEVGLIVGNLAREAVQKFAPCDKPGCAACTNMIAIVARTFLPVLASMYEALAACSPASHLELAHAVCSTPGTHEKLVEMAENILVKR